MYDEIYDRDGYVTPEKLKNSYLGIDIQQNTLLSMYDKLVEQKRCLVGNTIRDTTLEKYLANRFTYKEDNIMRQEKITIADNDVFINSIDGNIWLSSYEIAILFDVFLAKISSNIRSILPDGYGLIKRIDYGIWEIDKLDIF